MAAMLPVGHSMVSQRLTASRPVAAMLRNLDCNYGRVARVLDARDDYWTERTYCLPLPG